jgi:UDP-3-O-[3-hydroxymyristoyl] glucosamine N-acyltransferase
MAASAPLTVARIAVGLGARFEGAGDVAVRGAAEPSDATADDLALAMAPAYAEGLARGRAVAALLWEGADWRSLGLRAAIFAPRPRLALAGLTAMLDPGPDLAPGIHPSAIVDPSARLGVGAAIGPFAVIGRDVVIGARARIGAHCTIGAAAHVGDDAMFGPGVRIGARCRIGHRAILHSGAVIGTDGLSFVTPEKSGVERARETMADAGAPVAQGWTRIHSLGAVQIGDDVEVGANACIDRGTIRDTFVGDGCKIDNLVHIAHNVRLGRDCLLAALTGIAGSTTVGDRCVFGGQSGVVDNITIGNDVISTGGTKILSNVSSGKVMMGYPAVRMDLHIDIYKALRRLPRFLRAAAAGRGTGDAAVSKPDPSD